jgi:hypothetical protein
MVWVHLQLYVTYVVFYLMLVNCFEIKKKLFTFLKIDLKMSLNDFTTSQVCNKFVMLLYDIHIFLTMKPHN